MERYRYDGLTSLIEYMKKSVNPKKEQTTGNGNFEHPPNEVAGVMMT